MPTTSPAALRPIVLVGADGSPEVADALALAAAVAVPLGARVELAVVHPGATTGDFRDSGMLRHVAETTRAQVEEAGLPHEPGRALRFIARESVPAGLQALARTLRAELLVIGSATRGRRGRIDPGSTGRRVLGASPAPVAVAPRGYAAGRRPLDPVGVAHDGSPEAGRALDWAAAYARAAGAQLRLLTVHAARALGPVPVGAGAGAIAAGDLGRAERRARLDRVADSVHAEAVLLDGDPARQLLRHSRGLGLLVAGRRSHGPPGSLVLGGVSGRLVHGACCPVVIAPLRAAPPVAPGAVTGDGAAPSRTW